MFAPDDPGFCSDRSEPPPNIVIATPLASYAQINDDGGIETVTSIRIEEVLKGEGLGDSLTVVEPGGEYGGRATVIPGVPRFATSERALLFLMRTGGDRWAVAELARPMHVPCSRCARAAGAPLPPKPLFRRAVENWACKRV